MYVPIITKKHLGKGSFYTWLKHFLTNFQRRPWRNSLTEFENKIKDELRKILRLFPYGVIDTKNIYKYRAWIMNELNKKSKKSLICMHYGL